MNEQIRELAIEADIMAPTWNHVPLGYQKFAELIVRKCAEICLEANDHKNILRHFGVEA